MEEPQKADDKTIAAGAALAGRGDWSKGLPGCGQCHGAAGQGVGKTFPGLAGQSAEYIMSQLKAWKDGKRTNDPLHLMTGIASKLSDDQVAAVAAYYASLPVAAAAPAAARIKAMSEHRPDLRTWMAGVVFFGLASFIGYHIAQA